MENSENDENTEYLVIIGSKEAIENLHQLEKDGKITVTSASENGFFSTFILIRSISHEELESNLKQNNKEFLFQVDSEFYFTTKEGIHMFNMGFITGYKCGFQRIHIDSVELYEK